MAVSAKAPVLVVVQLTGGNDFMGVYATLLEQWFGLEAAPIVGGTYEQLQPCRN